MASEVTICNVALSHLGGDAVVSSISPPDGSTEAGYCKRFYDVARTEMLEIGSWSFSKKRRTLSAITPVSDVWQYTYALPSDCIKPLRIVRASASTVFQINDSQPVVINERNSAPFELEGGLLFTNEVEAVLIYIRDVTDTTKFTPSFVAAFGMLLASYIAGPMIKGSEGAKVKASMRAEAIAMAATSGAADANASAVDDDELPSSIKARL